MNKKFPVKKEKTLKQYLLAFFVLLLLFISFIVVLISVPYMFFYILKIFDLNIDYSFQTVLIFWLSVTISLWIIKITSIFINK